jgi:hypothetical protein
MADLSDVEAALVAAITQAAMTANGSTCPVLGGYALRVYRGTPPNTALTQDRGSGVVDISVFPVPDATRNTTRWGTQSFTTGIMAGLSVSVTGQTATFSGVAVAGELAGLLVNDQPFVYRASAGDTAALVAASLADLVRATQICWLQNASLKIPGAVTLVARTAGVASVLQEWARQSQDVRISVWAPSPASRDAVCGALSAALAQISFLLLADGSSGRLIYRKTASFDDDQVASIYRRDFVFEIEYGTTISLQTPTMLFGDTDYNGVPIYI